MMKDVPILTDVVTFGLIAFVAALFGFSDVSGDAQAIARVVCAVSVVLVALSLVVKRPRAL